MAIAKCFRVQLDKGCLCLGAVTFVLSCCLLITAVTCLTLEHHTASLPQAGRVTNGTHVLNLPWPKPVIDVALGIMLVTCVLWMLFSVVLFFGILKRHAACVMSYFLFGVFLTLILMVTALLELVVKELWPMSLATFLFTLIYICCLYSVFTAYDLLRQGKTLDEQPLMTAEDFEVDID